MTLLWVRRGETILAGTDRLRKDIEAWKDLDEMEKWWKEETKASEKIRKKFLIY